MVNPTAAAVIIVDSVTYCVSIYKASTAGLPMYMSLCGFFFANRFLGNENVSLWDGFTLLIGFLRRAGGGFLISGYINWRGDYPNGLRTDIVM